MLPYRKEEVTSQAKKYFWLFHIKLPKSLIFFHFSPLGNFVRIDIRVLNDDYKSNYSGSRVYCVPLYRADKSTVSFPKLE